MPSGSTRARPRSSPTRCDGSSTSRSGCSRRCEPAPRRRHPTGSSPPSQRTGWNASRSGRCTSRRSTSCSRSGSGGRSPASCWCGSRRRRAATRSMRWSSAARCSGTGIPTDAHGTLPVPDSLGSLIAGRVSRLPEPTRHAMLLAAAAAEPTVATLERASPGIEADLQPAVEDQLVVDRGWRRPVRPPTVRAVGAEPRAARPSSGRRTKPCPGRRSPRTPGLAISRTRRTARTRPSRRPSNRPPSTPATAARPSTPRASTRRRAA